MIRNIKMGIILLLLNILDAITTFYGLTWDNIYEMNPLCSIEALEMKILLCIFLIIISSKCEEYISSKYVLSGIMFTLIIEYLIVIINNIIVLMKVLI